MCLVCLIKYALFVLSIFFPLSFFSYLNNFAALALNPAANLPFSYNLWGHDQTEETADKSKWKFVSPAVIIQIFCLYLSS